MIAGYYINGADDHTLRQAAYGYCMAGNGLFLQAANSFIRAQIAIAYAEVRGLSVLVSGIKLINGRIPLRLFNLALDACLACLNEEKYFAITFEDGEYHLRQPEQSGSKAGVTYEPLDNVVMDLHSHGNI